MVVEVEAKQKALVMSEPLLLAAQWPSTRLGQRPTSAACFNRGAVPGDQGAETRVGRVR